MFHLCSFLKISPSQELIPQKLAENYVQYFWGAELRKKKIPQIFHLHESFFCKVVYFSAWFKMYN